MEREFTRLVETNAWGSSETPCGPGSTIEACRSILVRLPAWIGQYRIGSIADVGCGDFNWMRRINLAGIQYEGYDVVRSLIFGNSRMYQRPNVRFFFRDVFVMTIPKVDLVICKDILIHFPTATALDLLRKIRGSGSKFLAGTTVEGAPPADREGMVVGEFRPMDLEAPPFLLGRPVDAVEVPRQGGKGRKLLALWRIND